MTSPILTRLDAGDRALFDRWALGDQSTRRSRRTWTVLTILGGTTFTIGASLIPAVAAPGAWQDGGRFALAILIASHLLVQLIKRTAGRPRPSAGMSCAALIAEPDRFSFPSGHAAAAMSIAIGYGMAFPAITPLVCIAAAFVGFSRVALGVHYPGDVLAGQALAMIAAVGLALA
ncbi:MAG: phosphatase PAP2 family protein [Cytophagaceae bacterium]|nr:phosphatase PAP2 family protein [Gemmatimonadaceae bacterium]